MTTRAELSAAEEYGHGHTPLMRAALDGNTERVKELIHQGADINQRDNNGRTALMFAVINTHYETMKVLLEYGADVNVKSNTGGTALMAAALAGEVAGQPPPGEEHGHGLPEAHRRRQERHETR